MEADVHGLRDYAVVLEEDAAHDHNVVDDGLEASHRVQYALEHRELDARVCRGHAEALGGAHEGHDEPRGAHGEVYGGHDVVYEAHGGAHAWYDGVYEAHGGVHAWYGEVREVHDEVCDVEHELYNVEHEVHGEALHEDPDDEYPNLVHDRHHDVQVQVYKQVEVYTF